MPDFYRYLLRCIILLSGILFIPRAMQSQNIDFGNVQLTQYKDSSTTQTNPFSFAINATASYMKKNPSDFSIIAGGAPFTIPPGGTHTVKIRFTPSVLGLRIDTLVIEGTFPGSPYQVELRGTGIPLPVELQNFNAEIFPSGISLTWITATETNNYGFEIQRLILQSNHVPPHKKDGFIPIGFIAGSGNSRMKRTYSFTDGEILPWLQLGNEDVVISYRLKQIDLDGRYEFSPIVQIVSYQEKNVPGKYTVTVYPNPFQSSVTIAWNCSSLDACRPSLRIFDLQGRLIADLTNEGGDNSVEHAGKTFFTKKISKHLFSNSGKYYIHIRTTDYSRIIPLLLQK